MADTKAPTKPPEPEKDLEKLSKEQELEDAAFLDNLEKESKEFDKVKSHAQLQHLHATDPSPRIARSNAS